MAQATGIEWTDASSNPVKYTDRATGETVWACVKTSPGCAHCYSEALAKRYARGGPFTAAVMRGLDCHLCDKEAGRLTRDRKLSGKRVFVGDMTDVFGAWVPDAVLDALFAVFFLRPDVTFQVLTKRADRLREWAAHRNRPAMVQLRAFERDHGYTGDRERHAQWFLENPMEWPLPNVWLGVSVEDQQRADERIPLLLQTPAAVRFLSCEPLLGPVDLTRWLRRATCPECGMWFGNREAPEDHRPGCGRPNELLSTRMIDWAIVGGESGASARPFDLTWCRSIVAQCAAAGAACFVKQLGAVPVECMGETIDPPACNGDPADCRKPGGNCRLPLKDKKGGDPAEWPKDLRVRQFPGVARA